ncbi:MAG: hypothetical protein CL625_04570, partial [Arenimonas sp.]|nr:hypothetical protein [Arenimonas sp.]
MESDRIGNRATPTIESPVERAVLALAGLPLLVALLEWLLWSDALPGGWPGALSLAAPLLAGAGVYCRADRRSWMILAWALGFASLAVLWLAWPASTTGELRNPAPWLAAMAAAIGVGARVGGAAPAVGLVARSLGGFLVALALLSLLSVFDDSPPGTLALGLGSILAYLALGSWLMARDLVPGPFRMLRICTALLAGLALLVMTGWWLHLPYVVQGGTDYVPMQFNTALSALLIAISLRLLAGGHRNLALLPLAPVVIVCVASLLEEYTGLLLGSGEWLIRHGIVAEGVVPGRMAPNTATAYLLACLGIALAPAGGKGSPARWSATWACGFVVTVIALIVLAGYLMQVPVLRGWGAYTPMALMTAVAMLLIGVGLGAGGSEYRRTLSQRAGWLPLVLAAATIGVSLLVWFAIDRDQASRREALLQRQADLVEQAIQSGVEDRRNALRRMALRMADRVGEAERLDLFELDASIYLQDFPAFVSMIWTSSDARVLRQVSRPGEGVDMLGRTLDFEPMRRQLFETARRTGEVGESPPLGLLDGSVGELLAAPILRGGETQGFIVSVVKYEPLFSNVLANVVPDNALELRYRDQLLYARGTPPPNDLPMTRPVRGAGATIQLVVWPDTTSATPLANVLLFTGLLTGGLVALALRLAGLARARAEVAERRGRELGEQVLAAEHARLALEQAEQELSSVFESISDAFYTLDRDWRFVFVNPRAEQLMRR